MDNSLALSCYIDQKVVDLKDRRRQHQTNVGTRLLSPTFDRGACALDANNPGHRPRMIDDDSQRGFGGKGQSGRKFNQGMRTRVVDPRSHTTKRTMGVVNKHRRSAPSGCTRDPRGCRIAAVG